MRRRVVILFTAGCGALVVLAGLGIARVRNPHALWQIVGDRCVPGQIARHDPAPCVFVDLQQGVALLKDIRGATQYLLIPTVRRAGIEDPALLAAGAPNYFAAAWQARDWVERAAGHSLSRDAISLAINAASARSQDQLHIHVDCLRTDIRDALRRMPPGATWSVFPTPLLGRTYSARWLNGPALTDDPFRLLAETIPGARQAMGRYSLVLVGAQSATGAPGFILLSTEASADGVGGEGEDLQDHTCAVARTPSD